MKLEICYSQQVGEVVLLHETWNERAAQRDSPILAGTRAQLQVLPLISRPEIVRNDRKICDISDLKQKLIKYFCYRVASRWLTGFSPRSNARKITRLK